MKAAWKGLLLLAVLPLMMGCVEYEEEMWINEDGSGSLAAKLGFSEFLGGMIGFFDKDFFDEEKLFNDFDNLAGIEIKDKDAYYDGGRRWVEIVLNFDSVDDLNRLRHHDEVPVILGKIRYDRENKREFRFRRDLDVDITSDHDHEKDSEDENIKQILSGYEWKYTVHFPGKILETNGEIVQKSRNESIVSWVFPLAELDEESFQMEAYFK
ncbi:MAG: hypothetical protein H8E46_01020 [FCB group bacterium]|nr:hypothetical protein [FCB group bacterium]